MKVFISADIEGVTGTTHWDETEKEKADYREFQEQMSLEVAAACRGALDAGAEVVVVKDAHGSGRNILAERLPREALLIRGWSGHPYGMMQGLDETFDAAMMIGYHSGAGVARNPLAHTMTGAPISVRINGKIAPEFMINAFTAGYVHVPVVFVSGDEGLCQAAQEMVKAIHTVAVKSGLGNATVNIHPKLALEKIHTGVLGALQGDLTRCQVDMPDVFEFEIRYKSAHHAFTHSFYPGVKVIDDFTIAFASRNYMDLLVMSWYVL